MEKIEILESELYALSSVQEKIDAMNALAWELRYDDVPRAVTLSQAARELATQGEFKAQPYQKGLAESLRNLGHCYERLADYKLALSLLHEALSLFEATANRPGQATVLYILGGTYWSLGDYYNALAQELKAIKVCEDIGDKLGIGKALNIIGLVYQSVGDPTTALTYFLQSLQVYEDIGFKRGQGDALSNSCEVCFDLGEYDQALTYGLKSLQIHEEINYKSDMGIVLVAISRVYLALQQHRQASDYLHRALDISRETGNRYSELRALLYLGDIYGRQWQDETALSFLHQAVVIGQELGVQQELYECYQVLARVYKQIGNFEKALTAYEQFYTLKQKVLEEIARHKLRILEIVSELEAAKQETETQRLKNIELEQAVAERRHAEEALLAAMHQNTQLVAAINNLSSGVLITDPNQPDNPLIFVNPTFTDITGYSQAEVIGKNCRFLQGPDTDPLAVAEIRQAIAQKKVCKVTLLNYRKDGTPFWNELTISPVFDAAGQLVNFVGLQHDVTQRKQMEEALKESEDRLRHTFSTISHHVYVTELTPDGRPANRFVSPTEALTGYTQEKIMADWDFWSSALIHPDDRTSAAAQFQRFVRGESSEVEYRLIRADGRVIWVRDSGKVERDPLTQNIIVYGVVNDITARKQAEEALTKRTAELEETLNMLNGVIENLPVMLFMKDAETLRFTHFNKAAEDLVGLGRNALIGKNDHDFFPKEQADFFVSKDREVLAGGTVVEVAEEPIQTTQQGVRLLYTRKAPILAVAGKPKYLLGISIDITERKQIEEALLLQQKRLRSLYEITTRAELEVDHQFKAALEIGTNLLNLDIGIISQIEGNRYTILHFHAPAAPLEQRQAFELGQTYCDLTFKANEVISINHMGRSQFKGHPCYQAFQLEAYIGVPLWVGGKRFGTLNFSSPSPRETPFNQADQDFVELMGKWVSTTLERKQAEIALAQARDQALEASHLKSQLLAKVSHELRTPLGAILGYTELLQKGLFGPLSDKQLKAAAEVIDSTHYLTNLVNELLDQAQFETGKVSLNINPFIVADMVNQVESKMIVLAQAKGLTLTTQIAVDLPSTLAGDQKRLQQILVNLISNAIKFTETGGVQARLYQPDPAHWAIQVADTGIGIPAEAQAYIFEPFRQVDGSITRGHVGTGLGLSIVNQLTTLMGGQITVESEVGRGSTFTILLPLNPIQENTA